MPSVFTSRLHLTDPGGDGPRVPAIQLWLPAGAGRLAEVQQLLINNAANDIRTYRTTTVLANLHVAPAALNFNSPSLAKAECRWEFFFDSQDFPLPDLGTELNMVAFVGASPIITLVPGTGVLMVSTGHNDLHAALRWAEVLR